MLHGSRSLYLCYPSLPHDQAQYAVNTLYVHGLSEVVAPVGWRCRGLDRDDASFEKDPTLDPELDFS